MGVLNQRKIKNRAGERGVGKNRGEPRFSLPGVFRLDSLCDHVLLRYRQDIVDDPV